MTRHRRDGDRHELHTPDADQLVRDLVHSGAAFAELQVRPASLEEAFLTLTAQNLAAQNLAAQNPATQPSEPTAVSRGAA